MLFCNLFKGGDDYNEVIVIMNLNFII